MISHYKPFWKCAASDITGGRVHLDVWRIDLWKISPASEAPCSLGQMSLGNYIVYVCVFVYVNDLVMVNWDIPSIEQQKTEEPSFPTFWAGLWSTSV